MGDPQTSGEVGDVVGGLWSEHAGQKETVMDSFGDYKNKIFKKKNPFYQIVMKTKDGNSITISFPSLSSSG